MPHKLVEIDAAHREAVEEASVYEPDSSGLTLHILAAAVISLAACAVLFFASTSAYLWFPFSDVHNWIAGVFAAERSQNWLGFLWEAHTDQRIPIAKLATLIDIEFGAGRVPTFLVFGAILEPRRGGAPKLDRAKPCLCAFKSLAFCGDVRTLGRCGAWRVFRLPRLLGLPLRHWAGDGDDRFFPDIQNPGRPVARLLVRSRRRRCRAPATPPGLRYGPF